MIAGEFLIRDLEAAAKLGRCDACDLAESRGEGGRGLVADRERDVCYGQLGIPQKCLGSLNALHGQPLMRRMAGRHAKSRAEMEATEVYESGQFLQTDLLIQMLVHIGGYAFDLPIGQPTPRRRSRQSADGGMTSDELHAEKVDGLFQKKAGGWVTQRRLVTEEFQDARGRGLLETHPIHEFDALSARDLIGARL